MVFVLAAPAYAIDLSGRVRGSVGVGIDSNPRRDFVSNNAVTPIDPVLQGLLNLGGAIQGERASAGGSYDLGARKFFALSSEDTVIQTLQLDGVVWAGRFGFGVVGRARDRRGAQREYSDLQAEVNLQFVPDNALDFRIWGAAHRFIFWSGFQSSFYAPEGGLAARYRFNKRHSLSVLGNFSFRTFNSMTIADPDVMPPPEPVVRRDFFALASVAYWYRGPVVFSLSYGYMDSASNSYGWSLRQHRVGLVFGAPLFWKLMVMLDVNLRFNDYPSGIFIDDRILTLDESGENLSSGVLKLVRPLGEHMEIEARYGFYYGRLPKNDFVYMRHVGTVHFGVHF
ncbi:MAG: hypothetical protein JNK82_13120 [Myxococcaceae bacterium]|nr:hypothetical protein [Myxococcaceae bacterium]